MIPATTSDSAALDPLFEDLATLACAVWRLGAGEPDIGRRALGFALFNRRRASEGGAARPASGNSGRAPCAMACQAAMLEAGVPPVASARPGLAEPGFARAFAELCLIAAGDRIDPTDGATRFHRHDRLPGWAAKERPSALIGGYFYYR